MEPAAKRQRCSQPLRLHELTKAGISHRALLKVMETLQKSPSLVEELNSFSTRQIKRSLERYSEELWSKAAVMIDLQQIGDTCFKWHVQSPAKLLQEFCKVCPAWREAIAGAVAAEGSHLKLILYNDEIVPGNPLRPDNKRKMTLFYYSVVSLGLTLRNELAWIPFAALRHHVVSKVPGGLSEASKKLAWLFIEDSVNFSDGVDVQTEAGVIKVTGNISNVLGDESALKSFWSAKGAAGMRPCMLCKNVIAKGNNVLGLLDDTYWVDITEPNSARFDLATDSDIFRSIDRLVDSKPASSKEQFDNLQKAHGFSFNPAGVLCDAGLRHHLLPASSTTFDSMHCFYSNGIASSEIHLFLKACRKKLNLRFSDISSLVGADWKHPRGARRVNVQEVFSLAREDATMAGDSFKGMASEVLAILPFVRHVAELAATNEQIAAELGSFRALHQMLELVQEVKMQYPVNAESCTLLDNLQAVHLDLFAKAYSSTLVKPKHHFSRHIPSQLLRDKILLDTFVHERKHRLAKAVAKDVVGNPHFEKTVVVRMIEQQIKDLKEMGSFYAVKLLRQTHSLPDGVAADLLGASTVQCSSALEWHGLRVNVGDILSIGVEVAKVLACALVDGLPALLLCKFVLLSSYGFAKKWQLNVAAPKYLASLEHSSQLQLVPNWSYDPDGNLITLM